MTDNEIITIDEAIRHCYEVADGKCDDCGKEHLQLAKWLEELKENREIINRQKAEIERLQMEIGSLNKAYPCTVKMNDYCLMYARSLDDYDKLIGDISVEAIKEFAERLQRPILSQLTCSTMEKKEAYYFCLDKIDNLVKEMTEG